MTKAELIAAIADAPDSADIRIVYGLGRDIASVEVEDGSGIRRLPGIYIWLEETDDYNDDGEDVF